MQKLMTVSSGSFAVSSSSSTSTGTKRNKDSDSEGEEEDEERKRRKRELSPIKADGELGKMGEGRSIEFNFISFLKSIIVTSSQPLCMVGLFASLHALPLLEVRFKWH